MRTLLALAVALALGAGVWITLRPGATELDAAPVPVAVAYATAPAAPPDPRDARPIAVDDSTPAAAPPLPRSLRGTQPDGAYSVDRLGRFLPSPAVLRRFDYFLSASGEESAEAMRARIVADIEAQLTPEAAARAVALLDPYLAYREAARNLHDAGLGGADVEMRLQRLRDLRIEHFGLRTARMLFDEEDRLAAAALERARIEAAVDLDPEARRHRIAGLEAALPESMARARAGARLPTELARDVAALREAGAGADASRSLREARVGREAAERLAALDEARRAWDERVERYRRERDRLLEGDGAPASELEALLAEHFAPEERPRVSGLDRIDGVTVTPEP